MALTYAVGAGGFGLAFPTVFDPQPDLRWATLRAVGLAGVISLWVGYRDDQPVSDRGGPYEPGVGSARDHRGF